MSYIMGVCSYGLWYIVYSGGTGPQSASVSPNVCNGCWKCTFFYNQTLSHYKHKNWSRHNSDRKAIEINDRPLTTHSQNKRSIYI